MDTLNERERWALWFGYVTSAWMLYFFFLRSVLFHNSVSDVFSSAPPVVHIYLSAFIFAFVYRLTFWNRAKAQMRSGDLVLPRLLIAASAVGWILLFELLIFLLSSL